MRRLLTILLILSFPGVSFTQLDPGEAEEHFKNTNYLMAIPAYKNLLKLERDNADYNYKLGLCYIRTNVDKTLALQYLERAYKQPKHPTETAYYLAIAHTYNNNFDKALELFKEYRKKAPSKEYPAIDKYIESCISAKEMMKFPINVSFQNLGPNINTEYPDYYPFTTGDEKNIYFTSRRKDGKSSKLEFDGYFASEIYSCSYNGETFSAAKNITTLNSTYDDQVVGLSADGEMLFIFSTGTVQMGALYKASKKNSAFKKEAFIESVNEEKSIETTGFMSPDGNTIFFASNRSGGMGGYDIWLIRKLPNGQWGLPYNLGPEINTAADEDFPTLSVDGTIVYFSSNGHVGMGGYDLYKCDWNMEEGTFSAPKNIGYPLNTPFDERTISFAADGKHAYVSMSRKGGQGDLDLYRATFEDVEYIQTLFQVAIPVPGTQDKIKDALITITNEAGDVVGDYRANQNNGLFTIILGPGTFTLTVEADGYKEYSEKIKVNEFTYRMGKIDKIITLVKE